MDRRRDRTGDESGAGNLLRVDRTREGSGHPERALADESFLHELFLDLDRFLVSYVPGDWDTRQALVTEAVLSYITKYGELSCETTEQRESARGLLFRIARNAAVDWLRLEKPQRLHTDCGELSRETSNRLDLMRLKELVQALSDGQRELVRLRYSHNLSNAEISRRLDVSPRTVRRRLGRLLAILRRGFFRAS